MRYQSILRSILRFLLGLSLGLGVGLTAQPANALDRQTLLLLTTPLEPALFEQDPVLDPSIVTPDRISQSGLTPPSLWWAADQFGGELLSYWLAYPGTANSPRRVDILVDPQVWSAYDYLRRYTFISRFGTAAKAFSYNTRVFNLQGELLGAYICEFGQTNVALGERDGETPCSVFLNPYGRGAFSGSSTNPFGASTPTGASTPLN